MTNHIRIPDIAPVTQITAESGQKVFNFPFPIFHDSDLDVLVGTSRMMTGFTVFGAGSSKGGAVVFASAPAAGSRVTLRRKQVYARDEDFLDERAPTPHELNDAVDQSVAAIQELAEQVGRSVQRPLSADLSQPVSLDLPNPESGKLLGWNGSANALVNIAQVDTSDVLLKSQNLADLPDKAQARINLGLGSAATHGVGDFASAAQGAKADTALQSSAIGASVQAHDADLDWLAVNLSSAGRALVDDADASAQRTTLGLATVAASGSYADLSNKPNLGTAAAHAESDFATAAQGVKADSALQSSDIGASVQAHDADLDWLAANLSVAGRALVDDADASAQRTTLGLATVAASGSYADLSNKPSLGTAAPLDVDTDATLAANSDSRIASQKAVKAYVDAVVISPLSPVVIQEKQLLRQVLSSAVGGSLAAESLFNGLCDVFSSDTIGAGSSNQAYDNGAELYFNSVEVYSANLIPNMTSDTTPSGIASESAAQAWAAWQAFNSTYLGSNGVGGMYTNTIPAWLQYQFPSAQIVSKYIVSANSGYRWPTDWQFQGSNNGTSWTTLHTVTGNSASNGHYNFTFQNATAYTYYRLYVTAGAGGSYVMIDGLQMFAAQTVRDMTLVSNALSPAPAVAPSQVKTMVLWKPVDSCILNTDFTAEATRDGSAWTTGTLTDTGLTIAGFKVLWAVIDVSAQPSGTSVKYRLKTFNTKAQQVKGVALTIA